MPPAAVRCARLFAGSSLRRRDPLCAVTSTSLSLSCRQQPIAAAAKKKSTSCNKRAHVNFTCLSLNAANASESAARIQQQQPLVRSQPPADSFASVDEFQEVAARKRRREKESGFVYAVALRASSLKSRASLFNIHRCLSRLLSFVCELAESSSSSSSTYLLACFLTHSKARNSTTLYGSYFSADKREFARQATRAECELFHPEQCVKMIISSRQPRRLAGELELRPTFRLSLKRLSGSASASVTYESSRKREASQLAAAADSPA